MPIWMCKAFANWLIAVAKNDQFFFLKISQTSIYRASWTYFFKYFKFSGIIIWNHQQDLETKWMLVLSWNDLCDISTKWIIHHSHPNCFWSCSFLHNHTWPRFWIIKNWLFMKSCKDSSIKSMSAIGGEEVKNQKLFVEFLYGRPPSQIKPLYLFPCPGVPFHLAELSKLGCNII